MSVAFLFSRRFARRFRVRRKVGREGREGKVSATGVRSGAVRVRCGGEGKEERGIIKKREREREREVGRKGAKK